MLRAALDRYDFAQSEFGRVVTYNIYDEDSAKFSLTGYIVTMELQTYDGGTILQLQTTPDSDQTANKGKNLCLHFRKESNNLRFTLDKIQVGEVWREDLHKTPEGDCGLNERMEQSSLLIGTRSVPDSVQRAAEDTASAAVQFRNAKETFQATFSNFLWLCRQNMITVRQARYLIVRELEKRNLSERQIRRILPSELKDPTKAQNRSRPNKPQNFEDMMSTKKVVEEPQSTSIDEGMENKLEQKLKEKDEQILQLQQKLSQAISTIHEKNAKVKQLEEALEKASTPVGAGGVAGQPIKVRIPKKMFARLFSSLRNSVLFVELTADAKTREVYELEQVKQ